MLLKLGAFNNRLYHSFQPKQDSGFDPNRVKRLGNWTPDSGHSIAGEPRLVYMLLLSSNCNVDFV
jgi:hypothetical protein